MIWHEIVKVMKSPILYVLFFFFLALNGLIMSSHNYEKGELTVLTDLVEKVGPEATEETLEELSDDIQERLHWVNERIPSQEYKTVTDVFKDQKVWQQALSETEREQLHQLGLWSVYYNTGTQADSFYRDVKYTEVGESYIDMFQMKGEAAQTVREQFQKIEHRKQTFIESGEHRAFFFLGTKYEMHSFLFRDLGRALLFEAMILTVLITTFLVNYEFEQRSHLVVYATRKGRELVRVKLAATLIAIVVTSLSLIGMTLFIYFNWYEYRGLWNTPISTFFMRESTVPYLSWWDLSFIEYLSLFVGVSIGSMVLVALLTFCVSVFVRNSYLVFLIIAVIFGLGVWVPGLVPLNTNLVFAVQFTPFVLLLNPQTWFMVNHAFTAFPYYEGLTIGGWGILLLFMSYGSIRNFKKQSI